MASDKLILAMFQDVLEKLERRQFTKSEQGQKLIDISDIISKVLMATPEYAVGLKSKKKEASSLYLTK